MKMNRRTFFMAGTVVVLIAIAICMFIIGRGHTVYLDNKTMEYNGQECKAFHKVVVYVDGEKIAKLSEKDRGMSTNIGQTFKMVLEITPSKGDEPITRQVTLPLPYNMDGIIVNLPALMNGLPSEAYQEEFIPAPEPEEEETEDAGTGDEFEMESFE